MGLPADPGFLGACVNVAGSRGVEYGVHPNRAEVDADFDRSFDDLAAIGYRVAFRLVGTRVDAEDITQETLVRAYVRWRKIRGHAEPWVALVATNLALDAIRGRARHGRPPLLDHGTARARGGDEIGLVAERLELARLLSQLPRRQREVVVLRYLADRSEADTAMQLGTSVGSVKQHAHRGLAALRLAWEPLAVELVVPETVPDPGAS